MKDYKHIDFKFALLPNALIEIFVYDMEFLGLFSF